MHKRGCISSGRSTILRGHAGVKHRFYGELLFDAGPDAWSHKNPALRKLPGLSSLSNRRLDAAAREMTADTREPSEIIAFPRFNPFRLSLSIPNMAAIAVVDARYIRNTRCYRYLNSAGTQRIAAVLASVFIIVYYRDFIVRVGNAVNADDSSP